MFNKKQLVVMWIVALITCVFLYNASIMSRDQFRLAMKLKYSLNTWTIHPNPFHAVNWLRLSIIPLIIGSVMVVTLHDFRKN